MLFFENILSMLKGEWKKNLPPWVKGTYEGRLYTDRKHPGYIKFRKDQIAYFTQWELINGKMILTKDKVLKQPNIKDYYENK